LFLGRVNHLLLAFKNMKHIVQLLVISVNLLRVIFGVFRRLKIWFSSGFKSASVLVVNAEKILLYHIKIYPNIGF
jgi:hypothetical protein